jgi:hypothetical protein
MTTDLPVPEVNWKTRVYLAGGVAGLALGFLAAYLYARASEEHGAIEPRGLKTMDALKLAVALLAIVRQITDLGAGDGK